MVISETIGFDLDYSKPLNTYTSKELLALIHVAKRAHALTRRAVKHVRSAEKLLRERNHEALNAAIAARSA